MLYDRNYIAAIEAGEREPGPRFVKQLEMIEREIVSASPREQVSSSVVSEHAESFDPRQRFENYIAASGLTEEEFSARLKIAVDELRQMRRGEKAIEKKLLNKAGVISARAPFPTPVNAQRPRLGDEPRLNKVRKIPLVGYAQAGAIVDFDEISDFENLVSVEIDDPKAIAIRIEGDSMIDKIEPGDVVVCARSDQPREGKVVVARLRNEGVVCKMYQLIDPQAPLIRLISFNPKYAPIERRGEDFVWIYPVRKLIKEM